MTMNDNDVRDRFAAVDVPGTGLRVDDLVTGGRRRVARRRAAQLGCGAALAAALLAGIPAVTALRAGPDAVEVAAGAGAPERATLVCPATKLALPAGLDAVDGIAIDPTGRFIIGNRSEYAAGTPSTPAGKVDGIPDSTPVLWTDGQPRILPEPTDSVTVSDVNEGGVVVALGGSRHWDTVLRYDDGVPTELKAPAGPWTYSSAFINATGDILAGTAAEDDTSGPVFLWKAGSATATELPLPDGAGIAGFTDDGIIVGSIATGRNTQDLTSYAWEQDGRGVELRAAAGQAASVNAARGDWATGNLWDSGTIARWNLRTGRMTQLPVHAPAHAVNARGWIAGGGTVLRDDVTVELAEAGGSQGEAIDVSDGGLALGSPLNGDGGLYTWQCS
ncbi:hypothetical protein [Actinoplanes sp. NPDC051494]|uniref:hypothetical protein n=1 Tax=Actinoplanes sp. NPDC051494 TaxID=3363907 RepID=UPI0037BA9EA9